MEQKMLVESLRSQIQAISQDLDSRVASYEAKLQQTTASKNELEVKFVAADSAVAKLRAQIDTDRQQVQHILRQKDEEIQYLQRELQQQQQQVASCKNTLLQQQAQITELTLQNQEYKEAIASLSESTAASASASAMATPQADTSISQTSELYIERVKLAELQQIHTSLTEEHEDLLLLLAYEEIEKENLLKQLESFQGYFSKPEPSQTQITHE
eukprot:TRINITY_DN4334_c0_g1_i4.p1 TRINITY_DN4334_c0_g1~~TRINITY_DN4334_c0_g1_i4.p1  ORF type:complete len:226 (+),score=74.09 TRINITY_DN4334_c0_g1_i4:39-680(+)